jgi:tetratricopeptide (TPR) repeat protein
MTPTLSFCTIVKNEAVNLARCLDSVQPYVDEMIIVDTGSTDDTVAIAQRFGATIGHFDWCDDFSAARNYSLSLVTGDWILMLDADEELVVTDPCFRDCLANPNPPHAFGLTRKDLYETDDFAGGIHLRLYQNQPGVHYVGRFHEQLKYERPLTLGMLNGLEILHYGNSDENLFQKNINRDIPILEAMRTAGELDLWRLDCLARKYLKVNEPEKAQDCYSEALERLTPYLLEGQRPDNFFWIPTLLDALGSQVIEDKDLETAQIICQRGLEWCPNHPPLNYLTGELLSLLGFPRGALAYFQYCLEMGEQETYYRGDPFAMSFVSTFPAYGMGCTYMDLHDWDNAQAAFQLVLKYDPSYHPAQEKLKNLKSRQS